MIGRLRGTLVAKGIDGVVVDVAGVGYEIAMAARGLSEMPGVGEEAVVHVHTHVREDQLSLFGFPTLDERDLFRILLGASGVGPKVALAMLGTLSPAELRRAIASEDVATLSTVPGIGKRTAQKLVLELRERLDLPAVESLGAGSELAEVREALEALGYQPSEIREAMDGLAEGDGVQALLRAALRRLGSRR
ncbi:MAG TPA: Holliday junction branch migration protein RuvA [Acidimicrobiia bacterium]|nr:Holliday junction branch migration protein RuvA [Acidimicrobiia bacterium]